MLSYFEEKQRFTQWWIFLIPLFLLALLIYISIQQLVFDQPIGNNPVGNSNLWIIWLFVILLISLLVSIELTTIINKNGIHIRMRPFVNKHIAWEDLEEVHIRQYKPLKEYGGYGIRFGKKGTAYNVKGTMGLQLVLKNGKRILVGTQKASELESLLKRMKDESTRGNYF